eukprot:gnl/MRDRNA2_/MRDRNA2_140587_c0_seq1.p1 gnl/MRDRNA2_/MRDRNA2_140587_c0~~gnl/MRDRNA2_/MRDRNA2_140587_c0_seq1.p1  ORF type:complete len:102 (-),score=9.30 gnl/MRDRNA2_/MRDRNA2_140587_c0_seq1:28-333(-)
MMPLMTALRWSLSTYSFLDNFAAVDLEAVPKCDFDALQLVDSYIEQSTTRHALEKLKQIPKRPGPKFAPVSNWDVIISTSLPYGMSIGRNIPRSGCWLPGR